MTDDHEVLRPGETVDFFVQEHKADRAGLHHDIRLGTPETGLISWASKRGLPDPDGRYKLLVRQPVHAHSYGTFSGTIAAGPGKGTVRLVAAGKAKIVESGPNHLTTSLHLPDGPKHVRLVRIARAPEYWLAKEITPPVYERPDNAPG